jgi:hypothetical protein
MRNTFGVKGAAIPLDLSRTMFIVPPRGNTFEYYRTERTTFRSGPKRRRRHTMNSGPKHTGDHCERCILYERTLRELREYLYRWIGKGGKVTRHIDEYIEYNMKKRGLL